MRVLIILFLLAMTANAFAYRAVIRTDTNEIVYVSSPEFDEGKGIENATLFTGLPVSLLKEVDMDEEEISSRLLKQSKTATKIQEEIVKYELKKQVAEDKGYNDLVKKYSDKISELEAELEEISQ